MGGSPFVLACNIFYIPLRGSIRCEWCEWGSVKFCTCCYLSLLYCKYLTYQSNLQETTSSHRNRALFVSDLESHMPVLNHYYLNREYKLSNIAISAISYPSKIIFRIANTTNTMGDPNLYLTAKAKYIRRWRCFWYALL